MIAARPLLLAPLGDPGPDPALLRRLRDALSRELGVECRLATPLPVDPRWWDPDRGRLSSNRVVDGLIERFPDDDGRCPHWTLAVADAALVAPGRDFVFGEAALGGCWAVVALHNLRPPTLADGGLLDARLLTEALHELGHLAGLPHCDRPDCVMFASRDVRDTDRKGTRLCPACASPGTPADRP